MEKKIGNKSWISLTAFIALSLVFSGCGSLQFKSEIPAPAKDSTVTVKKINQAPIEPIVKREGTDVYIEMTAQITNVEISKGVMYSAWTFNGTVPGPVLRVKEGDTLHVTLKNMDPSVPHSMDMHAVHTSPSKNFVDVMPNETGTFVYPATNPGVFMYHCGTKPVLLHIANGMYGVIIVEPKAGYPTDKEINREYVITQNEWYKENDFESMQNEQPQYVVFNGNDFGLKDHPLLAKVGDKVRLYVNNLGPNHVSSFHVVGTAFDNVYIDGNPQNKQYGLQTVMLPASGGAVVEFHVTEEGDYPIVTHQFNDATKGAVAILRVTKDGKDTGMPARGH